jgi:DNA-directed RNA polymerase sigma subunit (sigma70/sigma32)
VGTFLWPSDDGWPYPDAEFDLVDPSAQEDDDLLCVRTSPARLLRDLDVVERQVITARFGLDGKGTRSFEQIQASTGLLPAQALQAMGSGLAKLRTQLG